MIHRLVFLVLVLLVPIFTWSSRTHLNGSVLIAMDKIDGVSLKKHVVGDIKAIEPKRQLRVWGEEKPVRRRCAATI